jgi:hypothetical protein
MPNPFDKFLLRAGDKSKFDRLLEALFDEHKISLAETATLLAALDCLSYEIENKGPQSPRLLTEYGRQILAGIESLNSLGGHPHAQV